jgi:hypothetical protein
LATAETRHGRSVLHSDDAQLGKDHVRRAHEETLFRDYDRMEEVTEECAGAIMGLEAAGAQRFIEAFAKHMEADTWMARGGFVLLRMAAVRRPSKLLVDVLGRQFESARVIVRSNRSAGVCIKGTVHDNVVIATKTRQFETVRQIVEKEFCAWSVAK